MPSFISAITSTPPSPDYFVTSSSSCSWSTRCPTLRRSIAALRQSVTWLPRTSSLGSNRKWRQCGAIWACCTESSASASPPSTPLRSLSCFAPRFDSLDGPRARTGATQDESLLFSGIVGCARVTPRDHSNSDSLRCEVLFGCRCP